MKKILTCILAAVMLTSLFAVGSAAETGRILFEDDFSDGFTNPNNWILDGNAFFGDDMSEPGNPCVSAYADGVVNQMEFRAAFSNSPKLFYNCTMSVDVRLRDFDRDGDHTVSLWWRDNFLDLPDGEVAPEGYEEGPVYSFGVNFDTNMAYLTIDGFEGNVKEAPVTGISAEDGWFNLGWRIVPGKVDCYLNNVKVFTYESAELLCQMGSPFLFWNTNNYISFDNLVVATADYDMFGDLGGAPETEATEAPETEASETTTRIDTEIVTNDDGETEVVTQVVTEAVETEADVADTVNTTANAGPSTTTGDVTFAVVLAMVAALGTAIVVKKVRG